MKFNTIDKYVGNELCKKRIERGLTMEEVAEFVGLKGKQSYRSYEKGRTSMPLNIYKKTCLLLGIDYIELFERAQKEMLKEIKNSK